MSILQKGVFIVAAKSQDSKFYLVPLSYFMEKLRAIGRSNLNVKLVSENPEANGVTWFRIHHGFSFFSYGEKITVTLSPRDGGTNVHILSECGMPTQIIDYGKNSRNVKAIFDYLEKDLVPPKA